MAAAPPARSWSLQPRGRAGQALFAFGIYGAVSLVLFGIPILSHPTTRTLSDVGPDPRFFMWMLEWWPHAVGHGTNPFLSPAVWAPTGYNVAQSTALPAPSLLLGPVTAGLGPVVAYNVAALLAPALAGWAAYLVCRRVVDDFWPAVAGGYLFGFSTYLLGQLRGHPNLFLVFLVPLCVYFVLLRLQDRIGRGAFVSLLTLALVFQFGTSTEVFATMTIVGASALVLGAVFADAEVRRRLIRTAGLVAVAYAVAAALLSPYLYYVFAYGVQSRRLSARGTDLLNFVIPTPNTLLGGSAFPSIVQHFKSNDAERGAYLGIPLALVIVHFCATRWRTRTGRLLIAMLAVTGLAALGKTLLIDGHTVIPMPWSLVSKLPLLGTVVPLRFTMYVWLIVAVMVAMWLQAGSGRGRLVRWGLVATATAMLLPDVLAPYWHAPVREPAVFADGGYRRSVQPGETVLIVDDLAQAMFLQAQARMYFRMAEGYTGLHPCGFQDEPLLKRFIAGSVGPADAGAVRAFMGSHDVAAVIVTPEGGDASPSTVRLLDTMGFPVSRIGEVLVYRVPGVHGQRGTVSIAHCR
jgi:hypothetical protein